MLERKEAAAADEMQCSCGEKLPHCPFWSKVLRDTVQTGAADQSRMRLIKSAAENVPEGVSYIIDSSKTARQNYFKPLVLEKALKGRVKVIHLVRDGRGCMWSNMRALSRRNENRDVRQNLKSALRTAVNWPLANFAAHLAQISPGNKSYLRVRYEDFVEHPGTVMERIAVFLELDLNAQIEKLEKHTGIPTGHQMAGNRLRMLTEIILHQDIEWKEKLRMPGRWLFWFFGWPLALYYKYR
jgi:hypothetical protein